MPDLATWSAPLPLLARSPGDPESSRGRAPVRKGRLIRVETSSDLVAKCRSGDERAFLQLFRAHREDVARLVFRMTGSSAELEDLVQDVFLQVHRSIGDFRGDARFSTWLYRLTVNVVLMHRRAAKSRPHLVAEGAAAPPRDPRLLPDDQVARARRVQAFYRLVERLSEKKRTVFVLHEIEGMAPGDIAKVVGAPVLTVRTRLFYARREIEAMMHAEPALSGLLGSGTKKRELGRVQEEST